ncbi:MAG: hypothetical protein JNM70_12400 [Anaerolineae bacterium]|nr:hypothetical protein [Anaerolineae bacterium]
MTYARARLYLGISGVGFWVIVSVLALIAGLPNLLFPTLDADPNETAGRLLLLIGLYNLFSLPFDLLGGYVLPRRFNRPAPENIVSYLIGWLRAALVQAVILLGAGMLFIAAGKQSGNRLLVAFLALVVMLIQVAAQGWIARLAGSFTPVSADLSAVGKALKHWGLALPDSITVGRSRDAGFVGGLAGLPGLETLIVPAAWVQSLTPEQVAAQIARRIGAIQTGGRERGLYLAILWNLIGFYIAISLAGTEAVISARGLFTSALIFNLWSFLGLLILPSLSRPGVYDADRFAHKAGAPVPTLVEVIETLDKQQDDEPSRTRWIETIFHPIPAVENRVDRLHDRHDQHERHRNWGGWHGARMALYLSWGCLGMLGRAVHCNSGRPELWVLFPGD